MPTETNRSQALQAMAEAVHNLFEACKKLKSSEWQAIVTKHITKDLRLLAYVRADDIKAISTYCASKMKPGV